MLLIAIAIVISLLALVILRYIAFTMNYAIYYRYRKIKSIICYNGILRYILQSNLKMGVAACTSLTLMNSVGSALYSSMILVGIAVSPIVFRIILVKNWGKLYRPSVKDSIGSIYLDLKEESALGLAYSQVFIVRRLLFLLLTFGLANYPNI